MALITNIIRGTTGSGAAGFDSNGVLWQTADLDSASAVIGGTGWYRPDGQDRAFQNVKSERLVDINYTNDTGREIYINVMASSSGATSRLQLWVAGRPKFGATSGDGVGSSTACYSSVASIIPVGATYRVTSLIGEILSWEEYR